jgi:hypothetical protein
MLFFRSEDEVAAWQGERNVRTGAILSLPQVWELSKRWYGNRLAREFRGRTAQEAQGIFRALGLTDDFWYVG